MKKVCGECKEEKQLGEFFTAPSDARSASAGTSQYCKQCHAEGNIKHGYGWYGEKYKSPEETK